MATQPRIGSISRVTSESDIRVEINLDGTGTVEIDTGVPFFDHMLTAFGVHGAFDLKVKATGDTHIDAHHTVEDTAIVLGQAIAQAVGDKRGIKRFGSFQLPMDETLCEAIVDFSGRPYFVTKGEPDHLVHSVIGSHYPTVLNEHFFESLALNAKITLHVLCRYGRDPHHITEAEFKAVARAIREAVGPDDRLTGIPSTKGAL
ncbi:imidazoleglycerol-phosphate dehydratase [Corynebacterium diphtheriae]|nr:imidazoleglycerol-phosphate dehydratase [Corynebacterium diphtheriae]